MSEKTAKMIRMEAAKAQKEEDKKNKEELRVDLVAQIAAAKKGQAEKIKQSSEYFIDQTATAAQKYRTVTGYMEGRTVLEYAAWFEAEDNDAWHKLAPEMAEFASELLGMIITKFMEADIEDYPTLLDEFMDKDFIDREDISVTDIATQTMTLNILQNTGPSIDDIYQFVQSSNEEIARLEAELASL